MLHLSNVDARFAGGSFLCVILERSEESRIFFDAEQQIVTGFRPVHHLWLEGMRSGAQLIAVQDRLLSFDTNVFDSLYGISEQLEIALFSALAACRARIVFQFDCLEECLLGLESSKPGGAEKVRRQIQRLQEWCDSRRIAKTADLMLIDDIRAYSTGNGPAGAFLEKKEHRLTVAGLLALRSQSAEQIHDQWRDEIEELRRRREQFRQTTKRTVDELRPDAGRYRGIPFAGLWQGQAITAVQSLVESLQNDHGHPGLVASIEARGFEGLLEVPSVRVLTSLTLSTMWEQLYRQAPPPEPQRSDAADYRLAVCSTAADVFVTNDLILHDRLTRIPALPVRVELLRDFVSSLTSNLSAPVG